MYDIINRTSVEFSFQSNPIKDDTIRIERLLEDIKDLSAPGLEIDAIQDTKKCIKIFFILQTNVPEYKMEEYIKTRISSERPPSQIWDIQKIVYPNSPRYTIIDDVYDCGFNPEDDHFTIYVPKTKIDDVYLSLVCMVDSLSSKYIKGFIMDTSFSVSLKSSSWGRFKDNKRFQIDVYAVDDTKETFQLIKAFLQKNSKYIYYKTDGMNLNISSPNVEE